MKTKKITSAILILMAACASAIAQSSNTETLTVPLSNPGKPYSLKANLLSGSIKVTGYDGSDIIINTTPGKNEEEEDEKQEVKSMKRIGGK